MSNLNATFGEGFFKQLIGTSITSNPRVAVIELIANAWDAGATKIEILWPKNQAEGIFEIRDNGHGMTEELFQKRYMEISYDRSKEQGGNVSFNGVKRKAYGKNGIGRFAGFCFSDPYLVSTSSDGKESWTFSVRQSQGDRPLDVKKIENEREFTAPGTCIFSSASIVRTLEENELKKEIGLRFLSDPSFEIYVNGDRVNLLDVPSQNVRKFEAKIEGHDPIEIIAIFTDQSDSTTDQHGVAWHVNGRLVGECRWKGPNGETFLDGRKTIAKRFTFIVKADCLSQFVNSDWTGFKPDRQYQEGIDRNPEGQGAPDFHGIVFIGSEHHGLHNSKCGMSWKVLSALLPSKSQSPPHRICTFSREAAAYINPASTENRCLSAQTSMPLTL